MADEERSGVSARAAAFRRMRRARRSEIAEDYVELIADLIGERGEARAVDLAGRLGVSQPTVAKALQKLKREGLVESRPYRAVFLTEKGRALAEAAQRRHQLVRDFLLAIGVSETTAEADAEGIEHHVSRETLAAFERLIQARGDRER